MTPVQRALFRRLRSEVADELANRTHAAQSAGRRLSADDQRMLGRQLVNRWLESLAREQLQRGEAPLDEGDEAELVQAVDDALFGLGALQRLLADDSIENIDSNGCDQVWITRSDGSKERGPAIAESDDELVDMLRTAAARAGLTERRFDIGSPSLNLQLADGSRLFAVMAVTSRPSVAIRRHRFPKVFLDDLVGLGSIDRTMREFLAAAVRARKNIIVAGGVDTGKTTLLRALLNEVPPHERIVTVEDNLELGLDRYGDLHPDVVALEARERNIEGEGAVTLADLVRWGLRMNPDRVIVGEVRGDEILPMLNAMSQGNDGSMCTVHANSSQGVFGKLAMYAVQAPERLPLEATNLIVAQSVDFVVHLNASSPGGESDGRSGRRSAVRAGHLRRFVGSVREVIGADGTMVISNEVFAPGADGRAAVNVPPRTETIDALAAAGFDPDLLHLGQGRWR